MEADLGRASAERDRMRAETEALQIAIARRIAGQAEADRRFRDLFENTDVGLAVLGLNGLIRDCNAAFAGVMGVETHAELRGRRITAFTHLDDRALDADVLTTLSLGARQRAWIVRRRLDCMPQLLLYSIVHDAINEPSSIVVRDASDLLDAFVVLSASPESAEWQALSGGGD